METKNNLQNPYWEELLFEGLFEKLLYIYKKLWFILAILWIANIAVVYIYKGWEFEFIVLFQILFSFPLAALGHATEKRTLANIYGKYIGRAARFLYCYLLGIIGYALIVLFPIATIKSLI